MSEERLVRSQRFERAAQALGYDFGGEIVIGGHYVSLIQHGDIVEIRADAITQNQDGTYSLRFPRFLRFRGFKHGEKI